MTTRLILVAKCLLVILLSFLAVLLPMGSSVGAVPAAAIIVYDHGFTKQITYTKNGHIDVNKTSTFTQEDSLVDAFFTAALATANVTWLWYDPDGQLFLNRTQQVRCAVIPCTFVYYFPVKGNSKAATRFGLWTLTLQAGGLNLYSDHFSITAVIMQDNYWSFTVTRSVPPRAHVDFIVTIHPNNGTWSSYLVYLPSAANITAHEFGSNRTLDLVMDNATGRIVVNLGAARSDGYRFVLSFDLASGMWGLGGNVFLFEWFESGYGTFNDGYHLVPGSFNITLPGNATFLDVASVNALTLSPRITNSGRMIGFTKVLLPGQNFGWTILYRDSTYQASPPNTATVTGPAVGLNEILAQQVPLIPLTLGKLSLWAAIMSVFLLTGSELLAPTYGKTGILVNRRRLRLAALLLASIFLVITVYELVLLLSVVTPVGR